MITIIKYTGPLKNETWKPLKGFEGFYEISNFFRVKSVTRELNSRNNSKRKHKGKILKPIFNYGNYQLTLATDKFKKTIKVRDLIIQNYG